MLVVMCQQWNPDRKLHSGYVKNYHLSIIMITLFYRMQRSWGKVIFSEECVKNSVHRGDRSHGTPPRQVHPRAGTPPGQVHPQAGTPPGRYTPWSMSGRYASYWNVQGLSVPIACVGSSDPVRVLRLYTTNTLDIF